MEKYELTLVLKKDLKKEGQEKLLGKIKKWLGKGKILSQKFRGKKKLAYPIKKQTEADYLFLELAIRPEKGGEIKKRLGLEEGVLRYLLTRRN